MNNIYPILVLIIIIILGFIVCKKNYKNRATYINNNLLEYCYDIVKEYNEIPVHRQSEFKQCLSQKELQLFDRLILKDKSLGKNLNVLQTQMFILESLMKKLREYKI